MGCRSCEKTKMNYRKGLWSPEEDQRLRDYILKHGLGCWSAVPAKAGELIFGLFMHATCTFVSPRLACTLLHAHMLMQGEQLAAGDEFKSHQRSADAFLCKQQQKMQFNFAYTTSSSSIQSNEQFTISISQPCTTITLFSVLSI
jgi:hypothetical protein